MGGCAGGWVSSPGWFNPCLSVCLSVCLSSPLLVCPVGNPGRGFPGQAARQEGAGGGASTGRRQQQRRAPRRRRLRRFLFRVRGESFFCLGVFDAPHAAFLSRQLGGGALRIRCVSNCVASSACEGVASPASLMIRDSGQAQVDRQITCIGNMGGELSRWPHRTRWPPPQRTSG